MEKAKLCLGRKQCLAMTQDAGAVLRCGGSPCPLLDTGSLAAGPLGKYPRFLNALPQENIRSCLRGAARTGLLGQGRIVAWNHGFVEWFGLKGTLKTI